MPRADRNPPAELASPAEQPAGAATERVDPPPAQNPDASGAAAEQKPPGDAPPADAPAPLPEFARVSPGRTLHTARGAVQEHATVEARDVGGPEVLDELVKAGSVYL